MPPGYELSLLGGGIFLAGGVADMVWHTLFGVEVGVDALYSPTHLVLGVGMTLIVSGPFRAAWRRPGPATAMSVLPMLFSLAFTLSVLTFFTQIAHPLVRPRAAGVAPLTEPTIFFLQALGVSGVLLQTAVTGAAASVDADYAALKRVLDEIGFDGDLVVELAVPARTRPTRPWRLHAPPPAATSRRVEER